MPSRDTIIITARSIAYSYKGVQSDGTFPSWDTLKEIYDRTMMAPPDWAIQNGANLTALKAGRWLRKDGQPGGTSDSKLGVSWCGIFAAYVLIASGVPVKWRAFAGITPLPPYLEKLGGFGNWGKIAPGDICIKGDNQHHFIIHRRSGDMLYSYDGNLAGQSIGERTTNVKDVHTIYRPLF
jgi:hypothetical protein